jgi:hypothetical protein
MRGGMRAHDLGQGMKITLERISQPRRVVGDHCRGIRSGTGQRPCPIYKMAVSHAEQSSLFIELTQNFLYVNFKLPHYPKIQTESLPSGQMC